MVDTLIGYIVEDEEMEKELDGCKCSAGYFLSDGSGNNAWMNLSGKITRLALVGSTEQDTAGKFSWIYIADDYIVLIEFQLKEVTEISDVSYFAATITVSKGTIKQQIKVPGMFTC